MSKSWQHSYKEVKSYYCHIIKKHPEQCFPEISNAKDVLNSKHARHSSQRVLVFMAFIYKAYPVEACHSGRAPFYTPDYCLGACGPNERQSLAVRALNTISMGRKTLGLEIKSPPA